MESHSLTSQRSSILQLPEAILIQMACRIHMTRSRLSNWVKKSTEVKKYCVIEKRYWFYITECTMSTLYFSPSLLYSMSVDSYLKLCMCLLFNCRSCHVLILWDLGWRLLKLLLLPICSSLYHRTPHVYSLIIWLCYLTEMKWNDQVTQIHTSQQSIACMVCLWRFWQEFVFLWDEGWIGGLMQRLFVHFKIIFM